MAEINVAAITGRLTKDPEMRQTTSGKQVCSFTVAVNRIKKKDQDDAEADFISCVAWEQTADYLSRYGHKGDRVQLQGRIQTRHYDDNDGKTIWVTEILCRDLSLIPKGGEPEEKPKYDGGPRYGNSVKTKAIAESITEVDTEPNIDTDTLPF